MARSQDPEADCTCDTLGARLERAERKLRDERAERQYAEGWYQALHAALDAHPAGPDIRADARARRAATQTRP
ncbi:hypothetical protein [Streptomyces qinglanensis]|nr:hypothetical protein [Streptomyces qinglanensis]